MRTLDELRAIAKEAQAEFEKRQIKADKEAQEMRKKAQEAREAAENAVLQGDMVAYSQAKEQEAFYAAREKERASKMTMPYFTVDEHNAIEKETAAALRAENAPLYERLAELCDEWGKIISEIAKNHSKAREIGFGLTYARPEAERKGFASSKWNPFLFGYGASDALSEAMSRDVREALAPYRKNTKKKV